MAGIKASKETGDVGTAVKEGFSGALSSLTFGFMWATVIVGIFCILFNKYIALISYVPYKYYFPFLVAFIVWACVQYTGGWEDYAILAICCALGYLAKRFRFSRPAMLMAFILASKLEALTIQ